MQLPSTEGGLKHRPSIPVTFAVRNGVTCWRPEICSYGHHLRKVTFRRSLPSAGSCGDNEPPPEGEGRVRSAACNDLGGSGNLEFIIRPLYFKNYFSQMLSKAGFHNKSGHNVLMGGMSWAEGGLKIVTGAKFIFFTGNQSVVLRWPIRVQGKGLFPEKGWAARSEEGHLTA